MKKHTHDKFEGSIPDESFLDYTKKTNPDNSKLRENWQANNPDKLKIADEVKDNVNLLNFKKLSLPQKFIDNELNRLNKRLNIDNKRTLPKHKKYKRKIWQYAAIFALLISLAGTLLLNKSIFNTNNQIAYYEIITPKGQIKNIILPDGSLVFLNSNTKLKYPSDFNTKKREVFLEGEAFFDITHNKHLPFYIHTLENKIKVLGTAFNISAYRNDNMHQISLERGKISISHDNLNSVTLSPYQSYVLFCNENQSKISKPKNIEIYSSWKEGKLIFRNQRFEDIARKLERSHNIAINIQNAKIRNLRYTGEFNINDDIRKILKIMSLTTPILYEIKNNTVIIKQEET